MTYEEVMENILVSLNRYDGKLSYEEIDDILDTIKTKLKKDFTLCKDCIHLVNGTYEIECVTCSHYYGSYFERK